MLANSKQKQTHLVSNSFIEPSEIGRCIVSVKYSMPGIRLLCLDDIDTRKDLAELCADPIDGSFSMFEQSFSTLHLNIDGIHMNDLRSPQDPTTIFYSKYKPLLSLELAKQPNGSMVCRSFVESCIMSMEYDFLADMALFALRSNRPIETSSPVRPAEESPPIQAYTPMPNPRRNIFEIDMNAQQIQISSLTNKEFVTASSNCTLIITQSDEDITIEVSPEKVQMKFVERTDEMSMDMEHAPFMYLVEPFSAKLDIRQHNDQRELELYVYPIQITLSYWDLVYFRSIQEPLVNALNKLTKNYPQVSENKKANGTITEKEKEKDDSDSSLIPVDDRAKEKVNGTNDFFRRRKKVYALLVVSS